MYNKFSAFVFRTRGLYMFIALIVSMVLKFYLNGTTSLTFFIIGLIIMVIAQIFRMYAASHIWGRQTVSKLEADFLCTSGPYAYIRNPFYLCNFLIGIGLLIAINEWYAYALFIISYIFVYSIVISYEERFLQEKFGDVYAEYKAHTRSLIPRLKGYKGDMKVIPNYKVGILSEIHSPVILSIFFLFIYLLFIR